MRLDDVEPRSLEHRAQLTRGPAVGADDGVVERFDLGAVEVSEKEGAARPEDSDELEERGHDPPWLVMNLSLIHI